MSLAAVRSPATLVFVHVLRVDRAGHRSSARDPRYLAAARQADRLVARLWRERTPEQTLMVLSDHGHHPRFGGHGGAEAGIRAVRACLAGPGIGVSGPTPATIPDVTRILADRLGLPSPSACKGRDLPTVIRRAEAAVELPGSGRIRILVGVALLACAIWLVARRRDPRRALALLPWGPLLGVALVALILGPPTLSRGYVFRSTPWDLLAVTLPPLLLATVIQLRLAGATFANLLPAVGWTVLPATTALALCGWPLVAPPLVPYTTAWASTLMVLALEGAVIGALGVLFLPVTFVRD